MTYTVGVEIRQYCTVTVEASTDTEAMNLAATAAISCENASVDRKQPIADICEIINTIGDYSDSYDRLFEERREENVA